jgi:hypothetical protein
MWPSQPIDNDEGVKSASDPCAQPSVGGSQHLPYRGCFNAVVTCWDFRRRSCLCAVWDSDWESGQTRSVSCCVLCGSVGAARRGRRSMPGACQITDYGRSVQQPKDFYDTFI